MSDFDRDVYCLRGLPFDVLDLEEAAGIVREAIKSKLPCFLSTPNLNFLIASSSDSVFRDSVIRSDLSVVDGMPLVWMGRMLGIPFRERVSGSTLFEILGNTGRSDSQLNIYFFGGPDGVAEAACRSLNQTQRAMRCVGYQAPGFVSVDEMSDPERIDNINSCAPDFVVVALGAKKGQSWIEKNRGRINAPVISHLGAVVNFVAGTVSRAPIWMQRIGLEWLWRIYEEPELWRRYWFDGLAFLRIFASDVLPYAIWLRMNKRRFPNNGDARMIETKDNCQMYLQGSFSGPVLNSFRTMLCEISRKEKNCVLDLSHTVFLGPAFFGLLLMLKKHQDVRGLALKVVGVSPSIRRFFKWNGTEYLLY